jgi:hypothetical protein
MPVHLSPAFPNLGRPGKTPMRPFTLAAVCCCVVALTASAQERSSPSQPQTERSSSSYRPELADLMSATQLRHFKLSFAGNLKNWQLAGFELAQMRKTFEAAAKLYPDFNGVRLAKLVEDVSKPALNEIGKAITAKDSAAFSRSFKNLTAACNSCHHAAKAGFIVIRVPTTSPFSNQTFSPAPK